MSRHILSFSNVTFRYPGGYEALRDVSFHAAHGEKVAVLGLNGAGKSTMLLHTNGLLLPASGEVRVGDVTVTRSTLPIVRRNVGMVFQNPDDQLFMPTVEDDVAFGPMTMRLPRAEVERRVDEALAIVGAADLRRMAPFRLSGGQKRAVAIATVLAMEPSVMVMDEPSGDLDRRARRSLIDMLGGFNHTCLIATHDFELAREVCPRAIVLDGGWIVADGPTDQLINESLNPRK